MQFLIRMGIPEMEDLWSDQQSITIIGLEPHPEDKKNSAYNRIALSQLPPIE